MNHISQRYQKHQNLNMSEHLNQYFMYNIFNFTFVSNENVDRCILPWDDSMETNESIPIKIVKLAGEKTAKIF